MEITKQEFERIVAEKIDILPGVIKKRLENVEFFVEERSPYTNFHFRPIILQVY